ncbi:MAG: M14 family metallopeptidase [Flavihumibacter sp.]
MRTLLLLALLPLTGLAQLPPTPFEKGGGNKTAAYTGIISYYQLLDKASPKLTLKTMGPTDANYPLHLALFSNDGSADPARWHAQHKVVLLFNNGIHPGEPDGIDASMNWLRDLVTGKATIPDNVALAFIPVYNIGGCLNRGEYYRVDQNGPEAFGSRGNSQNYDLNRDFIKADTKEALSFAGIFHYVKPDIFVDNHVSNGADYQHVMTLIATQHSKLGGAMGRFLNQSFEPGIYQLMKEKGYDLIPYVNNFNETPVSGWPEFMETPRYSTGYAALWGCFSFMPETHMLKPYPQRVKATHDLMISFVEFAAAKRDSILATRAAALQEKTTATRFPLRWELDKSKSHPLLFKGFEAGHKPSDISGQPRLYYDRSKPFEQWVNVYNVYEPKNFVEKPKAYIIPQGWWKVIERLNANQVQMRALQHDSLIEVEYYELSAYSSMPRPFEGHHLNTLDSARTVTAKIPFRKGDWLIPMNQPANRFIIETLEPPATDSYFVWNFFDPVLNQKEGYSAYMFEDTGAEWLKNKADVQQALRQRQLNDTAFAKNGRAQLDFVFKNSPWYETEHNRYPVYRLVR